MIEQPERSPYYEPPEAGLGGEGAPVEVSVLAPTIAAEIARGVHQALVLEPDGDADSGEHVSYRGQAWPPHADVGAGADPAVAGGPVTGIERQLRRLTAWRGARGRRAPAYGVGQ